MSVVDRAFYPFTMIDCAALDDERLSIYDMAVYAALCRFASSDNDAAFPSVRQIAEKARCSERQAQRALRVLEAEGYIEIEARKHASSIYYLTRTRHKKSDAEPRKEMGDCGAGGGCLSGTLTRSTELNKTYSAYAEGEKASPADAEAQDEPEEQGEAGVEEPRPLAEQLARVPGPMKQAAQYLLLKTGRPTLTDAEVYALRELERLHYPARVTGEIDTAAARFAESGRPLSGLTFEYLLAALRHQKSRRQAPARDAPGSKGGRGKRGKREASEQSEQRRQEDEEQARLIALYGGED